MNEEEAVKVEVSLHSVNLEMAFAIGTALIARVEGVW
jgi:hypothetical protein